MTETPTSETGEQPHTADRALEESTQRYRSLFTYNPHATFSVDLEGRYTDANSAAQTMTGRSLPEMQRIDFSEVIHPDDLLAVQSAFLGALARTPQQVKARVVHRDGTIREVKVTAIPVIVGEEVVGVHGITEDVTEANRLRHELEEANAAKVVFLANVSHEVRTPLTTVLGATELLMDEDLEPGPTRFVTMVHHASQRLAHLVDDILDFSRLEALAVTLRHEAFSVRRVIAEVDEWARLRAHGKGLSFTTSVSADVPVSAHGDAGRVSQVLANLVDNAIKFTSAGSVEVRVSISGSPLDAAPVAHGDQRAGGTPDARTWVRFDVSDTGAGIAEEKMASLFDPFMQADPSITRAFDGVGLGLAICHDLAHLMGGRLETASTLGSGSTFTFVVPLSVPGRLPT